MSSAIRPPSQAQSEPSKQVICFRQLWASRAVVPVLYETLRLQRHTKIES